MTLTEHDRTQLAARARQRVNRRTWPMVIAALCISPAVLIGFAIGWHQHPGHPHEVRTAVIIVAVTMVLTVGLILVARWSTRRNARPVALVLGADAPTRTAVRRALRAGYATDARTDALVRDQADRWRPRRRLMWVFPIAVLLETVNAILTDHGLERVLAVIAAALLLAGGVSVFRLDHRIRRYQGLHDTENPDV